MRPALDHARHDAVSSSTFRCLEIAGFETPKPRGGLADRRRTDGEALDDAAADRVGEP